MSQQHIPQPNSQSAAPAEVFDSTADAPHGQTVSALGTPGPKPGEVVVHTGQKNSLDFSIDRQFIPIDTFIWSTTQPRGTLLWQSPVHPSRVNPLVAYLSGIYNTWGGGIEFNFKVAGTGFHAGSLAFVRIPPNRRPQQFSTPTEWGAFEWVAMDPKTLEVLSLDIMDQRQLNFHYMKLDESDPTTFGGWIACYVLIPLNTSSTGTQQIAVQAFSRPGSTFTMNQLIMPTVAESDNPRPSILENSLIYGASTIGQQTKSNTYSLRTMAEGTQKWLKLLTCTLDGYWKYDISDLVTQHYPQAMPQWTSTAITTTQWSGYQRYYKSLALPYGGSVVVDKVKHAGYKATASTNIEKKMHKGGWVLGASFEGGFTDSIVVDSDVVVVPDTYAATSSVSYTNFPEEDYFNIPAPNEVFLMWYNGTSANYAADPQTMQFYTAASRGFFKNIISKDDCLFFELIDVATQSVLMTAKLYFEGFLTVHKQMANKMITNQANFVFSGYGTRTSPIPVTPTQMMTAILLTTSSKSSSVGHDEK